MLSVIKENKLIQMKICNISEEKNGIYGIKPEKKILSMKDNYVSF